MPVFEYRCTDCGEVSEFLEGVASHDDDKLCAACGSVQLSRILSRISIGRASVEAAECGCGSGASASCCGGACMGHN